MIENILNAANSASDELPLTKDDVALSASDTTDKRTSELPIESGDEIAELSSVNPNKEATTAPAISKAAITVDLTVSQLMTTIDLSSDSAALLLDEKTQEEKNEKEQDKGR
jgi:hypothetical protein